jgi:hypothetical protein
VLIRVSSCAVLALLLLPQPAAAQSSVYAGASGAVIVFDASSPTLDTLGPFSAVGGFVGLRIHDAWSIELHLDQGFGESPERERLEFFGRSFIQDRVGRGFAVLGVWKRRVRSRVGLAATFGLAARALETHTVRTIITNPDDPSLASIDEPQRDGGAGWTGGVFVPIRLAGGWSIAPEVRVAVALTGERGGWVQVGPGVRVMWGF